MIDRALIDRLIVEYANPFARHRAGRDEETLAALRGLLEELDHATVHDSDHLSKARQRMCETTLGDREALRQEVRAFQRAYLDETHGNRDPSTVTPNDVRSLREAFAEHGTTIRNLVNRLGVGDLSEVAPMVEAMCPVIEATEQYVDSGCAREATDVALDLQAHVSAYRTWKNRACLSG